MLYKAEESVPVWGEFDDQGRPIVYRCDIVIIDPRFGAGVIEIDGTVHHKERQIIKDMKKDTRLKPVG